MNVGHDTAYLTDAVGGGREGYYRDAVAAGEPPGVWYGAGADELGLAGEVDADLMEAIYKSLLDPRDPASHDRSTWGTAALLSAAHKHYQTPEELYAKALAAEPHAGPERRTELRRESEQKARQATAFVDMTFSPHKSYSVAAAAFEAASNAAFARGDVWEAAHLEEKFRAMEDGIMVGARASIDYLQDRAGYGRVGKHTGGSGRWTDAHRWVVAQFLQHDSRAKDPQLHVHQAVLNRQMCADGKWRALDTTAIKHWRPAAGAIGERVMEEYMSVRAGLRFEVSPDGTGRWLVGVDPELVDQFSKRSNDIDPRTEQLADVFRERYQREPSLHDWTRLAQQATLETRAPKAHHGETVGERMDRWEAETRNRVGANLAATAEAVLAAAAEPQEAVRFSPSAVAKQALADLGQKRSAFREADVTLAVSHHLPAGMGCGPERVRDLLEGLTQQALGDAVPARQADPVEGAPAEVLLDDGRSAYEPPSARTWTTAEAVLGEQLLRKAAVTRGAAAMRQDEAAAFLTRYAESRVELGYDKAQALMGVVTSGAMLESITAPAGTGKSFLLGAINDAWSSSPGRNMVGLATTQVAAEILAEEGLTTRNVTQWLAAQDRIAAGRPMPSDHELRLTPGTIVTVDEASMTSRQDLVDVQQQCAAAGAKLLAVGDPSQMGPVGPGGALADIAEHGLNYQLTQVFRFKHDWEKQASLDLRDGNRAAVDAYAKHGRLVDGGTREETERAAGKAWLADTLAGKESLLVTATNDEAARLCGQLRAELVGLGKVEQDGVRLGLQGTTAGVGDIVQARRNGWSLAGWEGNTAAPINRRTYEVTGLRNDGGLTVAPIVDRTVQGRVLGDAMQLPAMYVGSHLALGYAATAHAAEGRTVDTCHGINGTGMDAAAALVALTRGTECNTAWTVTRSAPSKDAAPGEVGQVQERTADAVLMDLLERVEVEQGALATIEQAERDAVSTM
ncbi:MAG: MobF family relaxase, partial [Candidatus Dormibacteria bacterium]